MTTIAVSLALIFHPQVAPVVSPSTGSEGLNRPAAGAAAVLVPQQQEALWLLADATIADISPATSSFESLTSPASVPMGSSVVTDLPAPTDSTDSTPPTSPPPGPPTLTDAQLFRLRMCESTDRYDINTGNGYYGAYQFDLQTWDGVARRHMPWLEGVRPNQAWPVEQDAMVRWLWSERGRYPWPHCGLKVGAP